MTNDLLVDELNRVKWLVSEEERSRINAVLDAARPVRVLHIPSLPCGCISGQPASPDCRLPEWRENALDWCPKCQVPVTLCGACGTGAPMISYETVCHEHRDWLDRLQELRDSRRKEKAEAMAVLQREDVAS